MHESKGACPCLDTEALIVQQRAAPLLGRVGCLWKVPEARKEKTKKKKKKEKREKREKKEKKKKEKKEKE